MADLVARAETSLPSDEVLVRAVQFFTNQNWRVQSQANRVVTFIGTRKVPIVHLVLAVLLTACFVIPGLIYYLLIIKAMNRLQNLVVTTTPKEQGCEVIITYTSTARSLVDGFVAVLPTA